MKKKKDDYLSNLEKSKIDDLFGFSDITSEKQQEIIAGCIGKYTEPGECDGAGTPKDPLPPKDPPNPPVNGGYGCDPGSLGTGGGPVPPMGGSSGGPSGGGGRK